MFNKNLLLRLGLFVFVFNVIGILCIIFESWVVIFNIVVKGVISAFICGILLDQVGHIILKSRIDPKNKAVFITGCDSGFGYLLAKRLDSKGFDVFAGCLSTSSGGGLELTETCSSRLRTIQVDITKHHSILMAKDFIRHHLGKSELWAVVNNAGIYRGFTLELCTVDHFKDVFDVNVMGTVRVSKAFLPMLRQTKGRLVNINSLAGRFIIPLMAAYAMTKHATVVFTETLQQEMAQSGAKVISIEPEFFQTSVATDDLIEKLMTEATDNLDNELKSIYKEHRIKKIQEQTKSIFRISSPNVEIVIDAVERAISTVYPQSVYTPCRNWIIHLILHSGQIFPKVVVQTFQNIIWELMAKYGNRSRQ